MPIAEESYSLYCKINPMLVQCACIMNSFTLCHLKKKFNNEINLVITVTRETKLLPDLNSGGLSYLSWLGV